MSLGFTARFSRGWCVVLVVLDMRPCKQCAGVFWCVRISAGCGSVPVVLCVFGGMEGAARRHGLLGPRNSMHGIAV